MYSVSSADGPLELADAEADALFALVEAADALDPLDAADEVLPPPPQPTSAAVSANAQHIATMVRVFFIALPFYREYIRRFSSLALLQHDGCRCPRLAKRQTHVGREHDVLRFDGQRYMLPIVRKP